MAINNSNPNPLQTYFVPLLEEQVNHIFNDLENNVSNGIISITAMTLSRDGTWIYYDQWENGYDADIANPLNLYSASNPGGTQIWGNNDPTDGIAPGFVTDIFKAGDFLVLRNVVPTNPRNPAQILFDGADKISASAAIAMTRGYWPQNVESFGGSVLGGAIEVIDTFRYGTEYKVPVGENLTNDDDMFSYSALVISAAHDGTQVQVDVNGDGDFTDATDVNTILNQGQTYVVRGSGDGSGPSLPSGPGINANSRVLTSQPVQVHLVTGQVNANYKSDSFTLTPLARLGNSYYSPVTTTGPSSSPSGPVSYFIYNPSASATLTVNYRTTTTTGWLTLAPGETARFTPNVAGSGIHFYTGTNPNNPDGATFDVIATYDSTILDQEGLPEGVIPNSGSNYDWGFTLVPQNELTTQVVVGWAQGSSDDNGNVVNDTNGSPLWVTATADTTVYVDWDGNPNNSANIAPNGQKYDIAYTVKALQSVRLYDNFFNDSNQTGARLFTTDGVLIAVAYGEDQTARGQVPGLIGNMAFGSTRNAPYIDVGTTVLPLPALSIQKFTNGQDANTPTGPVLLVGSTAVFTYDVTNKGGVPLIDVGVVDNGGPDPDFNPVPVTSGGFNIGDTNTNNRLDPGEVWKYQATRTVTPGQYTNLATVTAKDLSGQNVAPDADPSNHFGAEGAVVIEKQLSVDGGTTWLDADAPTGPVVLVGQGVQYRVAVTNNSTGGLAAIVDLTDTVITGAGTALDFTFGGNQTTSVAAGTTVYSDVITTTALAGQHTNRAAATVTVTDGTSTSPVAVIPDDANYLGQLQQGDLLITKDNGLTQVKPGQQVTYKIQVSNSGPATAINALVSDTFPSILTNITWTSIATGGATDNDPSGTGNINDYVTLPSGSSIIYTVVGQLAANVISNQVSDFATDTQGANNTSLGQSMTINGITAEAFYIDSSGYQTLNTVLWKRNEPDDDYGLGVSSNGEPNPATSGGDVNELSNQQNQEVIRLTKADDQKWTSLWVSSLDAGGSGNAERGTLYWSNSAMPDLSSLTTSFAFQYGDFGDNVMGDILSLSQASNFDANAKYLFFVAGPNPDGSNNDYLVWKATTTLGSLINTATVTAPSDFIDTNPNNNIAADIDRIQVTDGGCQPDGLPAKNWHRKTWKTFRHRGRSYRGDHDWQGKTAPGKDSLCCHPVGDTEVHRWWNGRSDQSRAWHQPDRIMEGISTPRQLPLLTRWADWGCGSSTASGVPNPYQLVNQVLMAIAAGNDIYPKCNNTGLGSDGAFPAP